MSKDEKIIDNCGMLFDSEDIIPTEFRTRRTKNAQEIKQDIENMKAVFDQCDVEEKLEIIHEDITPEVIKYLNENALERNQFLEKIKLDNPTESLFRLQGCGLNCDDFLQTHKDLVEPLNKRLDFEMTNVIIVLINDGFFNDGTNEILLYQDFGRVIIDHFKKVPQDLKLISDTLLEKAILDAVKK